MEIPKYVPGEVRECADEDGVMTKYRVPTHKPSFKLGYSLALVRFAWWKDGIQYVGTTGTTLKEALEALNEGD